MESEKVQQNKLTKWLNKLQRESWQLELVISGFAIFLMAGAYNWLDGFRRSVRMVTSGLPTGGELLNISYSVLMAACFFLLINLILHVLLRGMWISTIGLRYVSGDIDFESLKLAPRFDRFLRKKIGRFDHYILALENICSVVFAFTFLIVFMLLAVGLYLVVFIGFVDIVLKGLLEGVPESVSEPIGITIGILFLISGLLYFIDFITIGYIKRVKWFSRIYLPIYRLMSVLTLSFLYRPIYYNLIDNKFGRRVGLLLVPYVAIIAFIMSEDIQSHTWYPDNPDKVALYNHKYDDQLSETMLIQTGTLPSKFVKNGFLPLFIAYNPRQDNDVLEKKCPDFKPFHEPGIESDLYIQVGNQVPKRRSLSAADTALVCFSQLYEIHIDDSLLTELPFRFHRHRNYDEYGVMTILDVDYLPRGEHLLKVNKWDKNIINKKDTLIMEPFFEIPFWKE
ncbi:MAG: hypothetical protein AAFZ15_18785 [Bacteroidota bacterium]